MQTFSIPRILLALSGGCLFAPSLPALAEVNLKDASFVKTWVDLPRFQRSYNSRSLHKGLFGMGWCTEYEKSLDLSIDQQISLKDCRAQTEITYHRIDGPMGIFFKADNGETILLSRGVYIRTLLKTVQLFDSQGRLVGLRGRENVDLSYDDTGHLRKINFAKKYILRIHYDPVNRRIKSIEGPQQTKAIYRYYKDNLAEVHNAWKSKYNFTYDELQNLTRIDYPDKTFEKITYDQEKDWALSYQDRNKCQENYSYKQDENKSLRNRHPSGAPQEQNQIDHSTTQLERTCQNEKPQTAQIEFWHRTQRGRTYLERMRITRGTRVTETSFDPVSGAPSKKASPKQVRTAPRETPGN